MSQQNIRIWHAYTEHTSLTQTLKKATWNNCHKMAHTCSQGTVIVVTVVVVMIIRIIKQW
jgi:hypothetical protein